MGGGGANLYCDFRVDSLLTITYFSDVLHTMWTQIEKIHETGENTSADHSGSLDTGTTLFLKSIDYFSIFLLHIFHLL